ncbi:hypothetical protein [Spirosoma sp.]|uniref:hypothetical protein n=1 Tax=Spirosoma sp. TaxID=1899569 RepID=UPI0026146B60|nr:hypothetical protein [Spirosoma sp.]MCX6213835.1 hypothetical protein [Spirosoma sp.]
MLNVLITKVKPHISPLLVLLLIGQLTACKKGGVSPDGDPDALTLKAQQTELLNDASLPVAVSGTYQAVVIRWERFNNSDYKNEGFVTYDTPSIESNYYLQVDPTVGKDSIQLTFWGNGYGGEIAKRNLGRFKVSQVLSRTKSGDEATGYTLDSWQFGSAPDLNQIHIARLAYANKTELSYGMTLCRILDKSRADYGQIAMNITGQSDPTSNPRNLNPWGHFTFTRRSTGTLLNR